MRSAMTRVPTDWRASGTVSGINTEDEQRANIVNEVCHRVLRLGKYVRIGWCHLKMEVQQITNLSATVLFSSNNLKGRTYLQ